MIKAKERKKNGKELRVKYNTKIIMEGETKSVCVLSCLYVYAYIPFQMYPFFFSLSQFFFSFFRFHHNDGDEEEEEEENEEEENEEEEEESENMPTQRSNAVSVVSTQAQTEGKEGGEEEETEEYWWREKKVEK
jgi:hypothetical protein